jgi:IclR family acetate operon transcriptional repressor
MEPTKKKMKTSVHALEKALDLLDYLERNGIPMGVRSLEAHTGIPKATVQRLLDVLENRGFVRKQNGKYSLWVGPVHLARAFMKGDPLTRVALPVLKILVEISKETASLYVRQGTDRILIQRVESPHPLRFQTPIGERLPLHLGASGQVLCAGMSDEELHTYILPFLPIKLADGKILSEEDFFKRVYQVRERGFAIGINERYEGVTSVAAPVKIKNQGIIAAINIVGPSYRINQEKIEQFLLEIIGAAKELSETYQNYVGDI